MILVTGANGVVGEPLCNRLHQPFLQVSRLSADKSLVKWDMQKPLTDEIKNQLTGVTKLIHCAPIWVLPEHVEGLAKLGVNRIVVFSSTSVMAKQNTSDINEQKLVNRLQQAEDSLIELTEQYKVSLTILRPSMIYGYAKDQNVSHIANIIRRYRCMFVVGKAKGLRQPVHADDLIDAVLAVIDNPTTYNKQYNLAGAEVLTYKEMVRRIFVGLDRKPVIFSIPLGLFRGVLRLASKLSSFSYSPEMANRMNQNLIYNFQTATKDFGFQPQGFLEQPQRDLVK